MKQEMMEVAVFWPGDKKPTDAEIKKVFEEVSNLHEDTKRIKPQLQRSGSVEVARGMYEELVSKYSKTSKFVYQRLLKQVMDAGINPDDIILADLLGVVECAGPDDGETLNTYPVSIN